MVKTAGVTFRFAENHVPRYSAGYHFFTDTQPDHHQFTHDSWEANAEVWDARMGKEDNDFFNK